MGRRSRGDGRGARPPRRDHRRAGGGPRRSRPQVHGRRRLDGLGVRVCSSGARRRGCCHPRAAGRGVARWAAYRGPVRAAHGRGRTPRRRLLRADSQSRRPAARTGGWRRDLHLGGHGRARGSAPPGRLRAGRPRSAPVARAPRAGTNQRPEGARDQRATARRGVAISGAAGVRAGRPAVLLRTRGRRRGGPRAPGARSAAGGDRLLGERQVLGSARRRGRRRTGGGGRRDRARPDPHPRRRAAARRWRTTRAS